MAIVYKIHPAIGIARVGDSPDEFFIGPERIGEEPNPTGGFKDSQCRVKRQAARFRIFAHHDDGTFDEIDDADAEITWTVHLVNKKAANPLRGNTESAADMTIDPGNRTVNGPNQRQLFDNGQIRFSGAPVTTVALGEIRSDTNNHLLVLGGPGKSASPLGSGLSDFWENSDWYDDVSDGPVTATIKLRSDGSTPTVVGAWVIVAPPKFAPHQQSVITLYDRLLDTMIAGGSLPAPTTTSYTKDIFPILQRARDTQWVMTTSGAHTWTDPVVSDSLRNAIFNRLRTPAGAGGDMPNLNENTGDNHLTTTQYGHMQRWHDNNFTNDWVGVPAPEATVSPSGMDRAALEACVGGAFFPGIEAGGRSDAERPMLVISNYAEPLRLSHGAVSAGDLTLVMALPWQADFFDCGDNWWPVPRPDYAIPQGTSTAQDWDRTLGDEMDMVNKWSTLGFVVRQGSQHVEVDRCEVPSITLLTPTLNFQDVPQGPMGMVREMALSITFEVISPSVAVTLQYAPGGGPSHPQLSAFNTSGTVGPTLPNNVATVRFWVIYKTSSPGDVLPPQTLTLQDSAATQSWFVTVRGNTVARKTAAAALVLDRSSSMSEDRGDGQTKHDSLQTAASIFVDVMLEGDGAGIVRFNQDAQPLQPILTLGNAGLSDINRGTIKDTINGNGLDPNGSTSIGDGIFEGRGLVNAAGSFDVKSLVVLTDGIENSPRTIADVAGEINEFTYAVGLGKPQNISVEALQNISGNNGGYMLVTGAIGTDNRFMLQKYFLQILAGISNADIVLDPDGVLFDHSVDRVPFELTAGDAGVDVILLTPDTKIVDFRLQTPSGRIIEPWMAVSEPGMRFVMSNGVSYYRLVLPTELIANRFDGGGTWHALLTIGRPRLEPTRTAAGVASVDRSIVRGIFAPPARAATRRTELLNPARLRRAQMLAAERFGRGTARVAASETSETQIPYSLVVHAYSNLSLAAHAKQDGFGPGSRIDVYASLAQSGIPLENSAQVWVEVINPGGQTTTMAMNEFNGGQFVGSMIAPLVGVYRLRVRARGTTMGGEPFTREQTLTVGIWRGDPVPLPEGEGGTNRGITDDRGECFCKLLVCLLRREGVISEELEKRLREFGINLDVARKCVAGFCQCQGRRD